MEGDCIHDQTEHATVEQSIIKVKQMFKEKMFTCTGFKKQLAKDNTLALLLV